MPKGILQVMVTTQGALPLKDVKVTIIDGATLKVLTDMVKYTDADGKTPPVELDTVDKKYSLDENNTETMPYKNYNIEVEKEGFIHGRVIGVQLFDGILSLQNIDLLPRPEDFGNNFESEYSETDPEKLFDYYPNLQEGTSEAVLREVIIPQYVTVHLGTPNSSASNVRVPFRTYLKSVAASEIYPTWPYEALKANILCQVTFILNRVYTEWYRSRGYNFDITNSTSYDQKYMHNRATFNTTDRVVDEVFNNYVSKRYNRDPYFTEYCDGKQVTCRGLKQWGAYDKAVAGRKALQILQDYYGDVVINQTDRIENLPASYPGYPLQVGSANQYVRVIQAQLNRISDNYPSIPKFPVDGIFGTNTRNAVREFQRIFNLTQDGIVGKNTWYKISYIYVAVKKLAELTSEGEAIEDGGYPGYVVARGARGLNVMIVQFYLNQAAVYVPSISEVKIDGVFGAGTEAQVKNFQRYFNLTADGKVGALTWNKMFRFYRSIAAGVNVPSVTPPTADRYPGTALRMGSRGTGVSKIQGWLNGVSQYYTSIPAVRVDGVFGTGTQAAVMAFQRYFNLEADGVVGRQTWNRLYSVWQGLVGDNLI